MTMRSLSASEILYLWETGQDQHPLDRALTVLAVACPDKSPVELAALEIGRRDAYLLTLREQTLGSQLDSFAECPQCQERLEFSFSVADIRLVDPDAPLPPCQHTFDDLEIHFRRVNSLDLAAAIAQATPDAAQMELVRRCLLQIHREGHPLTPEELPPEAITPLKTALMAADPQAEILLDLVCPACGYEWQILFDIVEFFWMELAAQAKRLLQEIHILARTYGWREADILAMSPLRRQSYLNRVS